MPQGGYNRGQSSFALEVPFPRSSLHSDSATLHASVSALAIQPFLPWSVDAGRLQILAVDLEASVVKDV